MSTEVSASIATAFPFRETGSASWFGSELHGSRSASGAVIDMHAFSAAHRTIPLGTTIRVTNLANQKSIDLQVLDRGPFTQKVLLSLSYGAANELGFLVQGTTQVLIEAGAEAGGSGLFTVQAAVFNEEENARLLKERLNRKFENVAITSYESVVGRLYRVRVGSYGTLEKAELVAAKLALEGLEPVVLRKD